MEKETILHFLQPEIMQRRRKKRRQRIALAKGTRQTQSSMTSTMIK